MEPDESSLLLERCVVILYSVTMEKVLLHISDVLHGTPLLKNCVGQYVYSLATDMKRGK
jgi:hypothetical protein